MAADDPDLRSELSAAVSALGDVMLEMQRRKLLAKATTPKAREMLSAKVLTDEQVGDLASNAFEAGAMVLTKVGHRGATAFTCNPSEEP